MNKLLRSTILALSLAFLQQGSSNESFQEPKNCSQAQECSTCPITRNPCEDQNNLIRIGGSYSYLWLTPKGDKTFTGHLWGAQGIYEYRPMNAIYEAVSFSYRQGHPTGKNNTSDVTTVDIPDELSLPIGGTDKRSLLNFDVQGRIGYTFAPCQISWADATLFTGLGYWYMGQTLEQPGFVDVEFNYNEFYIPLGFSAVTHPLNYLDVGLNFIWMPQVYPAVTIIPTGGANWIIERTLSNILVELPITFKFLCRKNFLFEIKPYFEYWRDGQSIAETTNDIPLGLPGNTYLLPGVALNIGGMF